MRKSEAASQVAFTIVDSAILTPRASHPPGRREPR